MPQIHSHIDLDDPTVTGIFTYDYQLSDAEAQLHQLLDVSISINGAKTSSRRTHVGRREKGELKGAHPSVVHQIIVSLHKDLIPEVVKNFKVDNLSNKVHTRKVIDTYMHVRKEVYEDLVKHKPREVMVTDEEFVLRSLSIDGFLAKKEDRSKTEKGWICVGPCGKKVERSYIESDIVEVTIQLPASEVELKLEDLKYLAKNKRAKQVKSVRE